MVADELRYLGAKAKELLAAYDKLKPARGLATFEDVEKFWDEKVRPVIKDFRSMQQAWREGDSVPEDSVWHANWHVPNRA